MLAINTIFIDLLKGSHEISASSLKDFLNKGRKSAKKRINYAQLC